MDAHVTAPLIQPTDPLVMDDNQSSPQPTVHVLAPDPEPSSQPLVIQSPISTSELVVLDSCPDGVNHKTYALVLLNLYPNKVLNTFVHDNFALRPSHLVFPGKKITCSKSMYDFQQLFLDRHVQFVQF